MLNTLLANIQVVATVLFLLVFLGYGWSRVLITNPHFAIFGSFTLSLVLVPAICGLAAIPVVLLKLNGHLAMAIAVVLALIGYAVALVIGDKKNSIPLEMNTKIGPKFGLYIVGLWILVLSAQVNTNGEITSGARVGPDLFGYASAAVTINDGFGLGEVQDQINEQLNVIGLPPISGGEVTADVYSVSSFPSQVDAEFLLGAERFGLAIFEALVIRAIGEDRIWAVQSTVGSISFLTLILMALRISLSNTTTMQARHLFVPTVIALNVNLLYVWLEGGVGQVWVLPIVFLFGWIVSLETSRKFEGIAAGIFLGALVPTYFDAYIVLMSVAIFMLLVEARLFTRRPERYGFWTSFFATSALLAVVLRVQLFDQLGARISDSGIGGWMTPAWHSISDMFGLFNTFEGMKIIPRSGIGLAMEQNSSLLLAIFSLLTSLIIIWLYLQALIQIDNRYLNILVLASSLFVFALWIKTKFIDEASNYQFLKGFTLLLPVYLLVMSLYVRKHNNPEFNPTFRIASLVSIGLILASNLQFHQQWRQETFWISDSATRNFDSLKVERILENHYIINSPSYLDYYLIANRNLRLMEPGRIGTEDHTLAAVIDRTICDRMDCVKNVAPERILLTTANVYFVELPIGWKEIGGDKNHQESCSKIATKWTEINGNPMGQCGYW